MGQVNILSQIRVFQKDVFSVVSAHTLAQLQTQRNFHRIFFNVWHIYPVSQKMRKRFWTGWEVLHKLLFLVLVLLKSTFREKQSHIRNQHEKLHRTMYNLSVFQIIFFVKNPRQGFPSWIFHQKSYFFNSLFFLLIIFSQ